MSPTGLEPVEEGGPKPADYQQHMERMVSLSANKNTVHLEVTANGGAFAKSAIRVILRGKKIRVE